MRALIEWTIAILCIPVAVMGLLMIVVSVTGTSYAKPEDAIYWPAGTTLSAAQEHAAARAILAACPDLARYRQDLTWQSAQTGDAYFYQQDDYGWSRVLRIDIKVADNPHRIPDSARAWGHTLHYTLGGGTHPGVLGKKPQSRAVCDGGQAPGTADWFKPAGSMAFVNKWR